MFVRIPAWKYQLRISGDPWEKTQLAATRTLVQEMSLAIVFNTTTQSLSQSKHLPNKKEYRVLTLGGVAARRLYYGLNAVHCMPDTYENIAMHTNVFVKGYQRLRFSVHTQPFVISTYRNHMYTFRPATTYTSSKKRWQMAQLGSVPALLQCSAAR